MSDTTNSQQPAGEAGDSLQDLMRRAEGGDQAVLPALRRLLDEDERIWRQAGDLGLVAETSLVQLAAGNNLVLVESIMRKLRELKEELAGPSPSLLERLLVERVALGWLQSGYVDALAAQATQATTAQAGELRRRQDAAARRLLAAVRSLTLLRRHLRPAGGEQAKDGSGAAPPPADVPRPALLSAGLFDGVDGQGEPEGEREMSPTERRPSPPPRPRGSEK
jgi:hypothetical protein